MFGKLSVHWLLLPVVAASLTSPLAAPRRVIAAFVGGTAAALSLGGFYATTSLAWHMVNEHTMRNNATTLVGGALACAPLAAAVSGLSVRAKGVVLGGCLVIKPAVQALYALARTTGVGAGAGAALPSFAAELLAGGLPGRGRPVPPPAADL